MVVAKRAGGRTELQFCKIWSSRDEFGWPPGVGDGQGGLACCDSWGCKELDATELNWTELTLWSEEVKSLSRVQLFVTPWTVAYQAPPSMGFSRQEYWSGLPLPSPGHLPNPGIEPLTSEPWCHLIFRSLLLRITTNLVADSNMSLSFYTLKSEFNLSLMELKPRCQQG